MVENGHNVSFIFYTSIISKLTSLFFFLETKPHTDHPIKVRARKSDVITAESAVTSTTSDDSEKEDGLSLSTRHKTDKDVDDVTPVSKRIKKGKKTTSSNTSDEEVEIRVLNSTALSDVQDENLVSSATSCGPDENKRKRSVKRNNRTRKTIRLSILDNNNKRKSTARNNLNCRHLDDR